MEKLFVEYEEALALKELGFDEPCICGYSKNTESLGIYSRFLVTKDSFTVDAPLYSQAFKWLLNIRQDLCLSFWCDGSGKCTDSSPYDDSVFGFNTELECLKKLIEIVKNK